MFVNQYILLFFLSLAFPTDLSVLRKVGHIVRIIDAKVTNHVPNTLSCILLSYFILDLLSNFILDLLSYFSGIL